MLGVTWTFTLLSALFVLGRLVSRKKKIGRLFADDYIIIGSLGLGFVYLGFVTASVRYGAGRHAATLPIHDVEKAVMYVTLGLVPGILSFTVPKFAVILLLCSLLNPSRLHKIILWTLAVVNFGAITACIVIVYASCNPPYALWDFSVKPVCWDPSYVVNSSIFAGAFSAFMDLYLAVYPAVVLWQLQMSMKKKLGLSVALGFGVCAGAVAIHKCTTVPGVANRTDFTYGTEDLVLWTNIESNCVIIAACVPLLLPLLEMVFGRRFMSSNVTSDGAPSWRTSGPKLSRQEHLELGDGVPTKTHISTAARRNRSGDSEESILADEDTWRIIRHDRVTVEYESPEQRSR